MGNGVDVKTCEIHLVCLFLLDTLNKAEIDKEIPCLLHFLFKMLGELSLVTVNMVEFKSFEEMNENEVAKKRTETDIVRIKEQLALKIQQFYNSNKLFCFYYKFKCPFPEILRVFLILQL